jgi:spore coat protein CotF
MEVIILQGQLSQKESMFLEDLKKEEQLCVIKYQSYAQQAKDSQLSDLFNKLAGEEQKHYDTVNQLLQSGGQAQSGQSGGQAGQSGSQGGQQKSGGQMVQPGAQINLSQGAGSNDSDKYLLQDMLSTEKYVASAYNTGVFESGKSNVRQALQHIQQDEQNHGEQIFQYMSSHGMYQPQ